MTDVLKDAATALWEASVLPMSGDQADRLAEALAIRGLLADPAVVEKVRRKLDLVDAIARTVDTAVASIHRELDSIRAALDPEGAQR